MNNNLDLLNELADEKLKISIEYDCLNDFVIGRYPYELEVIDIYGKKVQSTELVMESIYREYNKNKNEELLKKIYDILDYYISCKLPESIDRALSAVIYQMLAEKEERAPFHLECKELLNSLRNNLKENKKLYRREDYKDSGLKEMLEDRNEFLKAELNEKIW